MLTVERLKEALTYNPDDGLFRWKSPKSNRVSAGTVAGSPNGLGYIYITLDWKKYRAHRLAWLYTTGCWPDTELDHIDGNRSNNRWDNLRPSNRTLNTLNQKDTRSLKSKSGIRGVTITSGGYEARITVYGEAKNLGRFDDPVAASEAYESARLNLLRRA